MELCNKGYNSNLKNLLVKHQNSSVYCHRWRLLSGVSLICFYGIILEIFLAELYGWLTPDERAFARLYPWNHEVAIFLGRRRESEVIYRKNCTCRGCFARSGLNTHPTPRGNWVFILYLMPSVASRLSLSADDGKKAGLGLFFSGKRNARKSILKVRVFCE